MRAEAALIAGLTLTSCAATAQQLGAVPNQKQLISAVDAADMREVMANVSCIDVTKCFNSRQRVKVRKATCSATGNQKAHCSYEVMSQAKGTDWEAKSNDFAIGYDLDAKPAWVIVSPSAN